MPNFKCYPITDPNSVWLYCPSFGAAIAVCVFFGIPSVAHIVQGFHFRKPFTSVLVMAGAWETAGYVFRILSSMYQLNSAYFTAQQLLILLAPLWINAFVYMVLGRMIHFFLRPDRVFNIRARRITLTFVIFDISAFLVQAVGGMMTTPGASLQTQKTGLHVYMGGVGLQMFFNCIFIALSIRLQQLLTQQEQPNPLRELPSYDHVAVPQPSTTSTSASTSAIAIQPTRNALPLLRIVYAVLALIIGRNIYRLVEFSQGVESNITMHEWYSYVFDALPMLAALVLFNVYHPGRTLRGANADFSEENKAIRKAKKEKKRVKNEEKLAKKEVKVATKASKKKEKKVKGNKGPVPLERADQEQERERKCRVVQNQIAMEQFVPARREWNGYSHVRLGSDGLV